MTRPAMRVESARQDGPDAEVVTTGARLVFSSRGTIEASARISRERAVATPSVATERTVATFRVGGGSSDPWVVASADADHVVLHRGALAARVRPDSVVELESQRVLELRVEPAITPSWDETHRGRSLVLDDAGGFGVYPIRAGRSERTAAVRRASSSNTVWIAVFPTRAPDPDLAGVRLAHEGRPRTRALGLDAAYPSTAILEDAARRCDLLVLHAYVWKPAPWKTRLRPGRWFLRRSEWRTPRHEPACSERFARVTADARRLGLRVLLYLSPRHCTAPALEDEVARVLAAHEPAGLYLDLVASDLVRLDATVRAIRRIAGPDRLLHLNAADEPFGTPRVFAPFVDAHCDLVLRGSEGTGGVALERFLRHAVSGRATSGAAGLWCHYGGALRERPPADDQIDAARAAGARLWRRSVWGEEALRRFDARA